MNKVAIIILGLILATAVGLSGCVVSPLPRTPPAPALPAPPQTSEETTIPEPELMPLEPSVREQIDGLFLEKVGKTYYDDWLIPKTWAPEEEPMIIPGMSEAESIEHLADVMRDGSNWVDLYNVGRFDCTEMSALVECFMEQTGYPTLIAMCHARKHAWVLVETEEGYLPVECTGMFIPWDGTEDMTYDDYFDYDELFQTIYEAEECHPGQFDWWNSAEVDELKLR